MATDGPPRAFIRRSSGHFSRSLSNLSKPPTPKPPAASTSELKLLRGDISQLLPLAGLESRLDARVDALENMLAVRLTRIETTLNRLGTNSEAAAGKAMRRNNFTDIAQQVVASCKGRGHFLEGGDTPLTPEKSGWSSESLGHETTTHSEATLSRSASLENSSGAEDVNATPDHGASDPERPFTRISALVDADRDIRWQLRELRSAIRNAVRPIQPQFNTSARRIRKHREGLCVRSVRRVCGPVLHPDGRFRSVWNICMAIFICYCGITIPLEIAFESDLIVAMCGQHSSHDCPSHQAWVWSSFAIDVWFMLDILVNCRTGYLRSGQFVNDDLGALKHYLKGQFVFDLVGAFPVNMLLDLGDGCDVSSSQAMNAACDVKRSNRMLRMLRMFKLAKLTRMLKLTQYLQYFEMVVKFNPAFLRVFRLCLWMIICCHWFGCIWWGVADWEMAPGIESGIDINVGQGGLPVYVGGWQEWEAGENTWLPPMWLKHSPRLELKFWHSFYWGAGIAFAMTPLDIVPVTALEAFVTTLLMCCGLLLNAFVISSFTSAFAAMDSKNQLAGKQLDMINNYLLLKSVPGDLRSRILEYFQYIYTSSQSMDHLGQLQHMPPNLTTQLALSVNAKLVTRCALFNSITNTSLVAIVTALEPLVFVPGQTLCIEGHALTSVFFINRGKVQLLDRCGYEDEEVLSVLSDSDSIGIGAALGLSNTRHKEEHGAQLAEGSDSFTRKSGRGKEGGSGSGADSLPHLAPVGERRVRHSARALTYCDVMALSIEDLGKALEHDFAERTRESTADAATRRKKDVASRFRKATNLAAVLCSRTRSRSAPQQSTVLEDRSVRTSNAPDSAAGTATPCERLRNAFFSSRSKEAHGVEGGSNGESASSNGSDAPAQIASPAGWRSVRKQLGGGKHCRFQLPGSPAPASEAEKSSNAEAPTSQCSSSAPVQAPAPIPAPAPALPAAVPAPAPALPAAVPAPAPAPSNPPKKIELADAEELLRQAMARAAAADAEEERELLQLRIV